KTKKNRLGATLLHVTQSGFGSFDSGVVLCASNALSSHSSLTYSLLSLGKSHNNLKATVT
ncbi:hypothetical protein Angca_001302, partial [Angiostrongylus cantonensis]